MFPRGVINTNVGDETKEYRVTHVLPDGTRSDSPATPSLEWSKQRFKEARKHVEQHGGSAEFRERTVVRGPWSTIEKVDNVDVPGS
jgi:hypothetical protein